MPLGGTTLQGALGSAQGALGSAQEMAAVPAGRARDAALHVGTGVAARAYQALPEERWEQAAQLADGAVQGGTSAASAGAAGLAAGVELGQGAAREARERVYAMLSEEDRELLFAAKRQVAERQAQMLEAGKALVETRMLDYSGPAVDKLLDVLRDKVKEKATQDPFMFAWIKRRLCAALDVVWEDVRVEAKAGLLNAVLRTEEVPDGPLAPESYSIGPSCIPGIRAFVLWHYLPYDKSVFGKTRDPAFVVITLLTLFPAFAIRTLFMSVVLLCICLGTPAEQRGPDEYQLLRFILNFKGMQFLTGGILQGLKGAGLYYLCLRRPVDDAVAAASPPREAPRCLQEGPGHVAGDSVFWLSVLEFLLNVVLVWVAFRTLPYSQKHAQAKFKLARANLDEGLRDGEAAPQATAEIELGTVPGGSSEQATAVAPPARDAEAAVGRSVCSRLCCLPCWSGEFALKRGRGGHLRDLLCWDVAALGVALLTVAALAGSRAAALGEGGPGGASGSKIADPMYLSVELFWGQVVYSLLSFPFALFTLPGLQKLLTHTVPTGYTRNGHVRRWNVTQGDGAARARRQQC